jgi:twitching motility two-component system response regulator PilH
MHTVLVVDDSTTLRTMIAELLANNGLRVIEAIDGVDAKAKFQADCPDLVIMDVVMPRMNGYELCRWVKGESGSANVPVIMCSTKNEDFDRHWALRQKADAYFTKPFKPLELMAKVQELLTLS